MLVARGNLMKCKTLLGLLEYEHIDVDKLAKLTKISKERLNILLNDISSISYLEAILIAKVFNNQPDELFYFEFCHGDSKKTIEKVKVVV